MPERPPIRTDVVELETEIDLRAWARRYVAAVLEAEAVVPQDAEVAPARAADVR